MNILGSYQPGANFWQAHPTLTAAGPFKRLHDSDKSRGKGTSSKLMWTVAMIWDHASEFYSLPEDFSDPDSKILLCFTDIFGDVNHYEKNKELVATLKTFYLKLQETPARRTLREVEAKLEERAKFINDTKYDLGVVNERGSWVGNTAVIIDKMVADTKKVYDVYEQALKAVETEQINETENKGGGVDSLSDQNQI